MFVVGRVLDPQGKPVPNATVAIALRRKAGAGRPGSEGTLSRRRSAMGRATPAAGSGSMRPAHLVGAASREVGVTAVAPGYGVGWAELDPDEDRPSAEITLMPEQVIEGRLFDVHGRPVPGAVVSVSAVMRTLPVAPLRTAQGRVRPVVEGPLPLVGPGQRRPGWPKPVASDADGRFNLHGIGRGCTPAWASSTRGSPCRRSRSPPTPPAASKPLKAKLQPARTVTGRVTYADTGRPAAHAEVRVGAIAGQGAYRGTIVETDADGRFRVRSSRAIASRSRRSSRRATLPRRSRRARMARAARPSRSSTWRCPAAS